MNPKEPAKPEPNFEKLQLVNKLFGDKPIRILWDREKEKYFISVVDVVSVPTESKDPRSCWKVLKYRLKKEGNKLVTICNQLKFKARDGKFYNTDVTGTGGIFRFIESIPSKNAEWIAKLGKGRIEKAIDLSLAAKRSAEFCRAKGCSEGWIAKRLKGIQDRKTYGRVKGSGGGNPS